MTDERDGPVIRPFPHMPHSSWPFRVGGHYTRAQLQAFVGDGKTIYGIIAGASRPDLVIITTGGHNATRAGYADLAHSDGSWTIHAQGAKGDQHPRFLRNPIMLDPDRTILLFDTEYPVEEGRRSAVGRFIGPFYNAGWEYETITSGRRSGDRLIALRIKPLGTMSAEDVSPASDESHESDLGLVDLIELRRRAIAASAEALAGVPTLTHYRRGAAAIRRYAEQRANGTCERCGASPSFARPDGRPYLEVHHIRRLADDGPDSPENVAALCANCHREAHFGSATASFREMLLSKVAALELRLSEGAGAT